MGTGDTTTAYPPKGGSSSSPPARVRVGLFPGAAPVVADMRSLLQGRLRIATPIFALGAAAFLIRNLARAGVTGPGSWVVTAEALLEVVLLSAAAVLWARPDLPMPALRFIELTVFGSLALFFACLHYEWFQNEKVIQHALDQHGTEGRDLALERILGASASARWFILIVVYGLYVPNTARRCGVVVGVMAALAIGLTVCLGLMDPEARRFVGGVVVDQTVIMLMAVAIALFGSYKISALEQEAAAARQVGVYTLREKLGGGGMGEVYRAEHALLRRPCAVKLIRPERAGDRAALARFEREVQATAALTNPNTVHVYDYGHADDGTFYYAMEYLPGLTLEQLVERFGPVPPGRVIHLLRQVCAALREAHAAGLVHRDIKPGNVIVSERGGVADVAKVLDFGLVRSPSRDAPAGVTQEGTVAGTPAHMAPEQAAGDGAVDARTDVYSLGSVAYHLLTGRPPFVGKSAIEVIAAHLHAKPTPPRELRPDVPANLEAVVLRCLEKDPGRRYQDVVALDEALAGCRCANGWTAADAADWWRTQGEPATA